MSTLGTEAYRAALATWMLRPAELTEAQWEALEAGRAESGCPEGRYPLPTPREESARPPG